MKSYLVTLKCEVLGFRMMSSSSSSAKLVDVEAERALHLGPINDSDVVYADGNLGDIAGSDVNEDLYAAERHCGTRRRILSEAYIAWSLKSFCDPIHPRFTTLGVQGG